jgi:expansin (peptidoglycan-binding protein)
MGSKTHGAHVRGLHTGNALRGALPALLLCGCAVAGCGAFGDGSSGNGGGGHDAQADTTAPGDSAVPIDDGSVIDAPTGPITTYGAPYTGGEFHLGPVDWDETKFHNACAPGTKYDTRVRAVEGSLLAGLWDGLPNVAGDCDSCIYVTTAKGKSALLRVVTYGGTTTNSIDVSPSAYAILNSGEYPRNMTWQFAKCPDTGAMQYEFQKDSSQWWTSLWVRNARVPLTKVEVKSVNHPSWMTLDRGTDGTLTDANGGFGQGPFSIRSTGIDGQQVVEDFAWPAAGLGSQFLTGTKNFQ